MATRIYELSVGEEDTYYYTIKARAGRFYNQLTTNGEMVEWKEHPDVIKLLESRDKEIKDLTTIVNKLELLLDEQHIPMPEEIMKLINAGAYSIF